MTDTWEEIVGSLEKPERSLVREENSWGHESEELSAQRRARSLQAIFTVMKDAQIDEKGCVHATAAGKKFDFWPASDCWFVYSTQRYGHGIEKLCEQILKKLLKDEKTSGQTSKDGASIAV